ncbi:MAG: undecaprenyl-diphosphate phosphatase [Thaumarchaeota archaeon]|nr:undecaprenyl-diphosphate phosphatase [Nitrososphaerota archaeon]
MPTDIAFILGAGVLLGVVQGISEWLPVSSKTQILIVSSLFLGLSFSEGYTLGLFLEIGSFIAATIYFRKEVVMVLKSIVGKGTPEGKLLFKYLLVLTLITGVMGIIIYVSVSTLNLGNAIGVPMIILGAVLILDGLLITVSRKRYVPRLTLQTMTLKDLIVIGFAQGLAAFPGVSRSGSTVSAMLLLGTDGKTAFRLSFLALIPASIGATLVTLLFSRHEIQSSITLLSPATLVVAVAVTVVVGIATITWLLRVAASERITTLVFTLGVLAIIGGTLGILFGGAAGAGTGS